MNQVREVLKTLLKKTAMWVFSLCLIITVLVIPLNGISDGSHTITNPSSLTGVSFTASTVTTEYPKGTRGLVAASLLLAYYDTERNSSILSGSYANAVAAYAYLLDEAQFEANGGTYAYNDVAAINELLSTDLSSASFGAKAFWASPSTSSAVSKIQNNEPVVLYLANNVVVVAYAYSTVSGVTTFTVHTATKDAQGNAIYGTTVGAGEIKSMLWLNTVSNHTHSMRYTGSDSGKHYQSCTNPNCAVHSEGSHNFTCLYTGGKHTMTCSCGYLYTFANHDCSTGTCQYCGLSTTHTFAAATCTLGPKCIVCATVVGSPLGHNYAAATCTLPQTCSRCSATTGSALGHNYAYVSQGSSGHIQRCTRCSAETTLTAHTLTTQSNGSSGHHSVCSICGYTSSTVAHSLTYQYNSSVHWQSCQSCSYQTSNSGHTLHTHYYSYGHYTECWSCPYSSSIVSHSYSHPCTGTSCTGCSYSRSAPGHNYYQGSCTVCSEPDPNYHTHYYQSCMEYQYTQYVCYRYGYKCSCGEWSSYDEYGHLGTYPDCAECGGLLLSYPEWGLNLNVEMEQ